MDLIAEDAARESLNVVMELMRQGLIDGPPLGLQQDDTDKKLKEWLHPIADAFWIAGFVVAGKAASNFLTRTILPSLLAAQSRSHKATVHGGLPREKRGGKPAPWKLNGRNALKDRRNKLLEKCPAYIIEQFLDSGILSRREDGSYWDAKAKPTKRCAKNESAMRSAIADLVDSAKNKKIAK